MNEFSSTIVKLAMGYNFINEAQVKEAVALLKEEEKSGKKISIEEILVNKKFMSPNQLDKLTKIVKFWEDRRLDTKFGSIAIESGFVSKEDVDRALQEQSDDFKKTSSYRLVGDILISKGTMTEEERDSVLREQGRLSPVKEEKQISKKIEYELFVSKDIVAKASIRIKGEEASSVTIEDVKDYLRRRGIVYGIIDEDRLAESIKLDDFFMVAEGTPPTPSIDAVINYFFNTNYLTAGTIQEDGTIDFKNRGDIPYVKKGELIAIKIPMKEGMPGKSIQGNPIPAIKPKDKNILAGPGVELSEENTKAFASLDGQPYITSVGKIHVLSDIQISGDVGLKTGHVSFDGSIVVSGTVQKDFKVKGGALRAKEILAAEIHTTGDVVSLTGIIGANIITEGTVFAKFINSAHISSYNDITVEKEIVNCRIYTSGAVRISRGKILSSTIFAKRGIIAGEIGIEGGQPSKLVVGTNEHIKKIIDDQKNIIHKKEEDIALIKIKLHKVESDQKAIQENINKLAQDGESNVRIKNSALKKIDDLKKTDDKNYISRINDLLKDIDIKSKSIDDSIKILFDKDDKCSTEITSLQEEINKIENEIKVVNDEIATIVEWAEKERGVPAVKINKTIFEGTLIITPNTFTTLKTNYQNVTLREMRITAPNSSPRWDIKAISETEKDKKEKK
ncbi:MAG: DUF342 domain-containing protein [Desulfobacterales bacterium]|nr:DUF342 domain-containing protein [Desulfobacterales bacterium]MBF0397951.1 DUF342 domain-containing protein [Desulfobacterales bacterium]